jgi:Ca2+/Na+ antiporter
MTRKWRLMCFSLSAAGVFVYLGVQNKITVIQLLLAIFFFCFIVFLSLVAVRWTEIVNEKFALKRREKQQQENKEKLERAIAKYVMVANNSELRIVYEKLLVDTVNEILNSGKSEKDRLENEKLVDSLLQEKLKLISDHNASKKAKTESKPKEV